MHLYKPNSLLNGNLQKLTKCKIAVSDEAPFAIEHGNRSDMNQHVEK